MCYYIYMKVQGVGDRTPSASTKIDIISHPPLRYFVDHSIYVCFLMQGVLSCRLCRFSLTLLESNNVSISSRPRSNHANGNSWFPAGWKERARKVSRARKNSANFLVGARPIPAEPPF